MYIYFPDKGHQTLSLEKSLLFFAWFLSQYLVQHMSQHPRKIQKPQKVKTLNLIKKKKKPFIYFQIRGN